VDVAGWQLDGHWLVLSKKKKKQGKINKDVQNWGSVADGFVGWWLNLDVEIREREFSLLARTEGPKIQKDYKITENIFIFN
jgi:hypothetical protein